MSYFKCKKLLNFTFHRHIVVLTKNKGKTFPTILTYTLSNLALYLSWCKAGTHSLTFYEIMPLKWTKIVRKVAAELLYNKYDQLAVSYIIFGAPSTARYSGRHVIGSWIKAANLKLRDNQLSVEQNFIMSIYKHCQFW